MSKQHDTSDRTTICPTSGTGTYSFPSGSIWCPSETCQPGGHFIKRVAFQQPPARIVDRSEWNTQPPKRQPTQNVRRASQPTSQPVKVEDEGFGSTGYDAFVKGDRS